MNIKKYIFSASLMLSAFQLRAQDVNVKLHLRGVYDSKFTLMEIKAGRAVKLLEHPAVKSGGTALLKVPQDKLPGEFVLRLDYRDKESSTPYPSERHIFINKQDLEIWTRPQYINNPDSTWFQKGEIENTLFARFSKDNMQKREQLGMLQNFLMGYDQPQSAFYLAGTEEYNKRRIAYNQWLQGQLQQNKDAFVSHSFILQQIPEVVWKGSETDRMNSLLAHYFDGIDFKDPILVKTTDLNEWMNKYVNIYGAMSTTVALRDSLFPLAGRIAIEKAREGNPLVYGWMVDYFYNGFESNNMPAGIKMLEPYLSDPRCLTSKRLAIEKRLQGIESMVPGSMSPDLMLTNEAGKVFSLHQYKTASKYKLVMFWSADCQHCKDLVAKMYPWYEQISNKKLLDVFAISVDDTESEIPVWEKAKANLPLWKHSRAKGGTNSAEANAYFVLSTPTMVLIDSKTNKIVALPESLEQLEQSIGR